MIQKYTCVPVDVYDVLIVTNGAVNQVERALTKLNQKFLNEILLHANTIYLDLFKDMVLHLSMNEQLELVSNILDFKGKTVFMFFNGLEYIQNFLCEVIDYYGSLVSGGKVKYNVLHNSYYYFDSSVAHGLGSQNADLMTNDAFQFNYVCTIVNDTLKKMSFMLYRIRGVCLDDDCFAGERVFSLRGLLRNFSNLERVELTSDQLVYMRDLVT